jgi:uncharacterized protein (DUF1501 family)
VSRRNPRYLSFLLTGAVIGLIVALVLVVAAGDSAEDPRRLLIYLGAMLTGIGALAGGGIAVLIESRRR